MSPAAPVLDHVRGYSLTVNVEITAHAAFRRRLYDHNFVPEAQAAASALT